MKIRTLQDPRGNDSFIYSRENVGGQDIEIVYSKDQSGLTQLVRDLSNELDKKYSCDCLMVLEGSGRKAHNCGLVPNIVRTIYEGQVNDESEDEIMKNILQIITGM